MNVQYMTRWWWWYKEEEEEEEEEEENKEKKKGLMEKLHKLIRWTKLINTFLPIVGKKNV